jgi:hypothetical protein
MSPVGRAARGPAREISVRRTMEDTLALLIPIIGVSIPLVIVAGRFIVQPIVQAITQQSQNRENSQVVAPLAQRLAAAEDRIQQLERSLDRVVQEQEFARELRSGRSSRSLTE